MARSRRAAALAVAVVLVLACGGRGTSVVPTGGTPDGGSAGPATPDAGPGVGDAGSGSGSGAGSGPTSSGSDAGTDQGTASLPPQPAPQPAPQPPPPPPLVPGRTLWSYGAGSTDAISDPSAGADAAGEVVLGFQVPGSRPGFRVFALRKVDGAGHQRWSFAFSAPLCDTRGAVRAVAPGGGFFVGLASGCGILMSDGSRPTEATASLDRDAKFDRYVFGADPLTAAAPTDDAVVLAVPHAPPGMYLDSVGLDARLRWMLDGDWIDWLRAAPGAGFVAVSGAPSAVQRPRAPHVTRYAADGSVAWSRDLPGGFLPEDAAVGDDGRVAVVGSATLPATWAGRSVGGGAGTPALLVLAPDGAPAAARNLEGGEPLVAALPGGDVAVVTRGCAHLWLYGPDLERRWERALDAACVTSPTGLAGDARQVVVWGSYGATADFGEGHATTAPAARDAFIAAFGR